MNSAKWESIAPDAISMMDELELRVLRRYLIGKDHLLSQHA
ncbi:hypothetical protein [Bacillus sp. P14.5]|nr:hypothetical protein [Bacillus sp. P14.5]